MPDFVSPDFWKQQWDYAMNASWLIFPTVFLVAIIVWKIKGAIDNAEVRGSRAHTDDLASRLEHVRGVSGLSEKTIAAVSELQGEVADLRHRLSLVEPVPNELQNRLLKIEKTASVAATAGTAVSDVLKMEASQKEQESEFINLGGSQKARDKRPADPI
jgi:hypothetical protein